MKQSISISQNMGASSKGWSAGEITKKNKEINYKKFFNIHWLVEKLSSFLCNIFRTF